MNKELKYFLIMWISLVLTVIAVCVAGLDAEADSKLEIETTIQKTAIKYGVDPSLALAIANVESNLNPHAIGGMGEIGLFQLRPEFHQVKQGQTKRNVEIGIKYLAKLKKQCSFYGDAYFICFNLGPNHKRIQHPKLFAYYRKVQRAKNKMLIAVN